MKRISLISSLSIIITLFTSCTVTLPIVPKAVNTIATADFADLNLKREDYQILNNITAEATVICSVTKKGFVISDIEKTFSLTYRINKLGQYALERFSGIINLGYLSNDYNNLNSFVSPEEAARRIAIYRAINLAKQQGADGLIEPLVSTNVSGSASFFNNTYAFTTTVTAKAIKLITNK